MFRIAVPLWQRVASCPGAGRGGSRLAGACFGIRCGGCHEEQFKHVVPVPMSDPAAVDPEETFVASIASCHMLWFLA